VGNPLPLFSSPSVATIVGWRDRSDGPARVLAHRGWLDPNRNAPLGIQSLANRNPVTSVALVGYLYEFWRPAVIRTNRRTITTIQFERASVQHRVGPDGAVALPDNALDWSEYFGARPFFNRVGVNLLVDDVSTGSLREVLAGSDVNDLAVLQPEACPPTTRPGQISSCIEAYEDRRALPRAYLAPNYATVPKTRDGWAARRWLAENRQIMLQTPVAEIDDGDTDRFDGVSRYPASIRQRQSRPLLPARIVRYTPNEVVVRTDPRGPGLVVLNDAYHPGWKAYVNGKPRTVMRVNSVVRGVQVQVGETEVRFVFENGFSRNVAISLGTLMLLVACVFVRPRLRGRRYIRVPWARLA
jgi:hypothetical protein